MLAKQNRLSLRKELHRIQKEGKIFHFPLFSLLAGQRLEANGESRFGFIVSNKIHKKATKRNRVKRLLREAVQMMLPEMEPGFDIVFLARKKILEQDWQAIKAAVEVAFREARIL